MGQSVALGGARRSTSRSGSAARWTIITSNQSQKIAIVDFLIACEVTSGKPTPQNHLSGENPGESLVSLPHAVATAVRCAGDNAHAMHPVGSGVCHFEHYFVNSYQKELRPKMMLKC